jgi:hypothetical protein
MVWKNGQNTHGRLYGGVLVNMMMTRIITWHSTYNLKQEKYNYSSTNHPHPIPHPPPQAGANAAPQGKSDIASPKVTRWHDTFLMWLRPPDGMSHTRSDLPLDCPAECLEGAELRYPDLILVPSVASFVFPHPFLFILDLPKRICSLLCIGSTIMPLFIKRAKACFEKISQFLRRLTGSATQGWPDIP